MSSQVIVADQQIGKKRTSFLIVSYGKYPAHILTFYGGIMLIVCCIRQHELKFAKYMPLLKYTCINILVTKQIMCTVLIGQHYFIHRIAIEMLCECVI